MNSHLSVYLPSSLYINVLYDCGEKKEQSCCPLLRFRGLFTEKKIQVLHGPVVYFPSDPALKIHQQQQRESFLLLGPPCIDFGKWSVKELYTRRMTTQTKDH